MCWTAERLWLNLRKCLGKRKLQGKICLACFSGFVMYSFVNVVRRRSAEGPNVFGHCPKKVKQTSLFKNRHCLKMLFWTRRMQFLQLTEEVSMKTFNLATHFQKMVTIFFSKLCFISKCFSGNVNHTFLQTAWKTFAKHQKFFSTFFRI